MAESSNLLINDSSSIRNFNHVVYEDVLKLAKNEIIRVLKLEDDEEQDEIINDLLKNGRQSLSKYKKDLIPEIYDAAIDGNDCELMKYLKNYFEQQWKVEYGSSNEWFTSFLNEYSNDVNYDSYQCVLNRTAEYGNKYLNDCPILSIVLQLLFKDINNERFNKTNVFNDIWFTITNNGLKSIEKYSEYINEHVMFELIHKKQLVLFQALREYYHPELFKLLEESKIRNQDNLYELALNNVAEYGWLKGLQAVERKIKPKSFTKLLEKIPSSKKQQPLISNQATSIFSEMLANQGILDLME
ncbi:unnamed protein product [Rotaria sp. Silwood1]|nr:unnamed protein product [Rotaria sp. Silwood1]CAF1565667.1 unnamed protein product [Rotaria sp. Silwood1]CAF3693465.1 unnamed protein product [Rotaria sp. Silwood1]